MTAALKHLHRAASAEPRHAPYTVHLARALVETFRTSEALHVANIAAALPMEDALLLDTLGNIYMRCHAHERAMSMFRRAAALAQTNADCRFNYATSLVFAGDIDRAESELEACLTLAPNHCAAHEYLSQIRRQSIDSNHIDRLLSLLDKAGNDRFGLMRLHLALSKEYEDLGNYPKAFEHTMLGKSAVRGTDHYSIDHDEAIVAGLIDAFPEPQLQPAGYLTDEPIFVMGMPRSGTTLLERILSSHPEVYAAGELANFGVALKILSGDTSPKLLSPEVIHQSHNMSWERLGDQYLSSTRPATSMKPRFIDKLPHNFLYAGFIANALPNAKIICLRRNPLDTCLSNFRMPFPEASPFYGYSFDLLNTGRYYILFDRLMAHWKRIFPGRILEVHYETLVASQEASSRQLLEFCNLPWDDACLSFERNRTPASTASATQVRQPIHKAAVGRWRRYEAQLAGLRDLLTTAGINCDQ
ncbi:MAG TPA: sulfotransferase [Rhodanobacter sp.]